MKTWGNLRLGVKKDLVAAYALCLLATTDANSPTAEISKVKDKLGRIGGQMSQEEIKAGDKLFEKMKQAGMASALDDHLRERG